MTPVHCSFEAGVAAVATTPETRIFRAPDAPALPSRRKMRGAMESVGLFAFGLGATSLLIHFAIGFFAAARMSSALPPFSL